MFNSGIYKIENVINNHCYIGSAINFNKRFGVHRCQLNKNMHHSVVLQRAWNKYGKEGFNFEVIEEVLDKSKLIEKEQYYLDKLSPKYNICLKAGSPLGIKLSEEHIQKLIESHKGKTPWNKGIPMKEDQKIKISLSKKGCISPNKGKKLSKEWKQKLSLAKKGKRSSFAMFSDEQVCEIKNMKNKGQIVNDIAKYFNVNRHTISGIINNRTYKTVKSYKDEHKS